FPLLSRKAGFSLNTIMLIYSAGFIIYYFICYLLCGLVFKNYKLGLVLLLFNILFVSHTFYWAQSELPQGISFMLVYFAFISNKETSNMSAWSLCIMFVCLFTIVFFHPLIVFPFIYIILFFLIDKNQYFQRKLLHASLLFFIIISIIKKIVFATSYDQQSMEGISNFVKLFPHYFTLYSDKKFFSNCISHYYWIPLLSLLISIIYIICNEWKKLILFLVFIVGFILLINVSYPDSNTTTFYIENLYLPAGIVIGIPFVYDIVPLLEKRKLSIAIIALIIITGCIRIYTTHNSYTARLNWERHLLKANLNNKLMIDSKKAPMDTALMIWGTPYEFWLLSTTENHQTASIIIYDNVDALSWTKDVKNQFVTTWGAFPYSDLPKKYFIFKDTVTKYTVIK
ncbi:MAG TPA: hypothetical protein VN721_17060, partial [Flavipsychrobacter sp.]|nr:hypothetical protein [Flavipsychrobacter sp.]